MLQPCYDFRRQKYFLRVSFCSRNISFRGPNWFQCCVQYLIWDSARSISSPIISLASSGQKWRPVEIPLCHSTLHDKTWNIIIAKRRNIAIYKINVHIPLKTMHSKAFSAWLFCFIAQINYFSSKYSNSFHKRLVFFRKF